jgi:hypothetical protein
MDLSKIDNDFTDGEVERINTYVSNGCVGLEGLVKDEHKVNNLFALYMSGKTYTEISKISRVKKDMVLYMAAKMKWYEKRMEYLDDIQNNITKKLTETRMESMNFISSLISMHHKYYGDAINQYLRTGDRDIIDGLDLKQLTQYFKSIEMLEKVLNPSNVNRGGGSNTTVNINTPGGKVEQVDEKTIEITPGNAGDALRALAKLKDEEKNDN